MKTIICAIAVVLLSACGTTSTINSVIDPSISADPMCQPRFGLSGCYSGGSSE